MAVTYFPAFPSVSWSFSLTEHMLWSSFASLLPLLLIFLNHSLYISLLYIVVWTPLVTFRYKIKLTVLLFDGQNAREQFYDYFLSLRSWNTNWTEFENLFSIAVYSFCRTTTGLVTIQPQKLFWRVFVHKYDTFFPVDYADSWPCWKRKKSSCQTNWFQFNLNYLWQQRLWTQNLTFIAVIVIVLTFLAAMMIVCWTALFKN